MTGTPCAPWTHAEVRSGFTGSVFGCWPCVLSAPSLAGMMDGPEGPFDDSGEDNTGDDVGGEEQEPLEDASSEAEDEDRRAGFSAFAQLDWSSIMPKMDFSGLMSTLNLGAFLPKFRREQTLMPQTNFTVHVPATALSKMVPTPDLSAYRPKFDLAPNLLPKANISGLFPDMSATFGEILRQLEKTQPPNWPFDVDIDRVAEVVQDDGLPLTWVPRASIVAEVLEQDDHASRIQVLLDHREEIVADCRQVLDQVAHEDLAGQTLLARRAADALADGHHEAAQALAVVVTETAVVHTLGHGGTKGQYAAVQQQVGFDPETVAYTRVRLEAALAPLGSFFTGWFPNAGTPAPKTLSRHVSVHQADPAHYTEGHGLTAVMLAVSILRGLQEHLDLSPGPR